MWLDNDIDNAFQRLNPPEPEPASFPLDAWLRLETQLDKAVIEREVRRKLWRYLAAEVAVVALVALGWLLWPAGPAAPASTVAVATKSANHALATNTAAPTTALAKSTSTRAATQPRSGEPGAGATMPAALAPAPTSVGSPASAAVAGAAAGSIETATVAATRPTTLVAEGSRPRQRRVRLPIAADGPASRKTETTAAPRYAYQPSGSPLFGRRAEKVAHPLRRGTVSDGAFGSAATGAARGDAGQTVTNAALAGDAKHPATANATAAATVGSARRRQAGSPAVSLPRPSLAGAETAIAARVKIDAEASVVTTSVALAPTGAAGAAAPLAARLVELQPGFSPTLPAPLATVAVAAASAPTPPGRPARFYVGLVAAPDVSTVNFADVQSPLPNVGVTLEYRLTDRLRFTTGLLRSTKHYTARREDYDWGPYASRVYQRDFRNVEGNCTVLDVPLNLRCDVLLRPRYRLFGSAGVSSYFMQREAYSYAWADNSGTYLWRRDAVNENRHLLSILNLSAGYERSLSARWSLQAEPYVKLPLGGVGAGNVRLTSAGVFVGVKYDF